jgi:hypothetical protein
MPDIVEIEIGRPGEPVVVAIEAGFRGPPGAPGVGGAQISPDPDNALTARQNGLFVPASQDLGTFN